MQFKLAKTYRYWWPVTVQIPDPETPGKIIEQQLKIEFEPMPQADLTTAQAGHFIQEFEVKGFKLKSVTADSGQRAENRKAGTRPSIPRKRAT